MSLRLAIFLAWAACVARALQVQTRLTPIRALRGGSTSPTSLSSTTSTEQAKSGLGWDSHKAIDDIPESLVNVIEGNESMRRKFEALCRGAQNSICKAIEEADGVGKFREDAWVRESGKLCPFSKDHTRYFLLTE